MEIKKILYLPEQSKWSIEMQGESELAALIVDEETILAFELIQGKVLTDETYEQIVQFDQRQTNYLLAIRYLSRRRTISEVRAFLLKKCNVMPDVATQIIEKLIQQKYLDDEAYAKASIHDQMVLSKKAFAIALKKVKEKGITDETVIEAVVDWYDTNETLKKIESDNLHFFIKQQVKKHKQYNLFEQKKRIIAKMLQKGYNKGEIESLIFTITKEEALDEYEKMRILEKSKLKIAKMNSLSQYLMYMRKYNITKEELITFFNQERMNNNDY